MAFSAFSKSPGIKVDVFSYPFICLFFTLQTLPFFVINKLGHLHGLPGMFTACLYAGALRYITQFGKRV